MKRIILFFTILLSVSSWAQLANFTITATKQNDETCPSNGAISWSVSGTTPGAILTYNIVDTTTNTVVLSTTSNSFGGLTSGSYKVVATQTFNNNSNQATSNTVAISNQVLPLTFSLTKNSDEICGMDGEFTVNVSSGRAPYIYQLLDANNNNVTVSQSGNTFSNLAAGNYKVRVVDQCGAGTISFITIQNTPSNINFFNIQGVYETCSNVKLSIYSYNWNVKYPLTMSARYTNPLTGLQETKTGLPVQSGMPNVTIPNFTTVGSLDVEITVADACGTSKTIPKTFYYQPAVAVNYLNADCGGQYYNFSSVTADNYIGNTNYKVIFGTTPAGFDPFMFNPNHGTLQNYHSYGSTTQPLPVGTYNYTIEDACGGQKTGQFTVNAGATPYTVLTSKNQCQSGLKVATGVIQPLSSVYSQVRITSAPASFVAAYGALPYSVPDGNFRTDKRIFTLPNLPYGDYSYEFVTGCSPTVYTGNFSLAADVSVQTATIETNCAGQFKVNITNYNDYYFVQKYYPALGKWGKDPYYYTDGTGTNYNNTGWSFSHTNFNTFQSAPDGPGRYRIIPNAYNAQSTYKYYENNQEITMYCDAKVIGEFEVGTPPKLINAYAFLCSDDTYNVSVVATGNAPLNYSLVSDGTATATTLLNNGTSSLFTGLTGGTYYFRVTDECGQFETRKLQVSTLGQPGIKFIPNCSTNTLQLKVEGLDYLSYEWYKSNDPSIVLSTTNILDLGVFTPAKAGTYKVRMYTTNPNYCINKTVEINVTSSAFSNGLAGTGQTATITYNGTDTQLNLFDYLTGPYDGYGLWTEVSGPQSNLTVDNLWNIGIAGSGTYIFKYTVTSPCTGATSFTLVTINLIKVCYKLPVTYAGTLLPSKHGITALGRAGAENSNWPMVRQSAWTVLEAKTKGFVVNRVANPATDIANPVEGMMVFDTTAQCLKIYNGTVWSCYSTPACP